MFDCANVEMRELLPELAAGMLDAETRARVEAHVLGCAECASELETLKLVRASYSGAPAINAARIVAALPKPPARATRRAGSAPRVTRWMDWRVAAALTMVTVGGLSVAITQRTPRAPQVPAIDSSQLTRADSAGRQLPPVVPTAKGSDSGGTAPRRSNASSSRIAKAELEFGGGSDGELDDAALRALLGALDEIDRGPVAPSAEPDRSPVLPIISEGAR